MSTPTISSSTLQRSSPRTGPGSALVPTIALLSVIALAACSSHEDGPAQSPRTVLVHTVAMAPEAAVRFSGRLRATERSDLSFEVSGPIASIRVDLGDRVTEGEVLAQLDERPFLLDLEARRADLQSAIATRDEARTDFQRHERLLGSGAVSRAQYDRVQARARSAQSRVEALAAAVDRAEETLEDTRMRAPYDGEIAARLAEPSELAMPGRPVLRLVGSSAPLEAVVLVPSSLRQALSTGARASVIPPGESRSRIGSVVEMGSEATPSGLFPVTVRLNAASRSSEPAQLRPGESADVHFDSGASTPLVIPLTAYVPLADRQGRVLVLEESEGLARLQARSVELGALRSAFVEVRSGLEAGDRIVERGVEFLDAGDAVRAVERLQSRYNF